MQQTCYHFINLIILLFVVTPDPGSLGTSLPIFNSITLHSDELQQHLATLTIACLSVLAYLPVKRPSVLPHLGLNVRCLGCVNSFEGTMSHLQSVRLAIPARVVMGTWGISPFMLKMRSRGRVNAQAAKCHQSLPNRHISNVLQRQRGGKWMFNIKRVRSQSMQHYSFLRLFIIKDGLNIRNEHSQLCQLLGGHDYNVSVLMS